jgi:hypothetical protein
MNFPSCMLLTSEVSFRFPQHSELLAPCRQHNIGSDTPTNDLQLPAIGKCNPITLRHFNEFKEVVQASQHLDEENLQLCRAVQNLREKHKLAR